MAIGHIWVIKYPDVELTYKSSNLEMYFPVET